MYSRLSASSRRHSSATPCSAGRPYQGRMKMRANRARHIERESSLLEDQGSYQRVSRLLASKTLMCAYYRGSWLLLTTFYVTIYVTRTDSEISVEGTIIILTSKRNLHLKESPYLIFLMAVEFFSGYGTRFFRFSWQGRGSSERAATLAKCHPRGQYPNPMYPG